MQTAGDALLDSLLTALDRGETESDCELTLAALTDWLEETVREDEPLVIRTDRIRLLIYDHGRCWAITAFIRDRWGWTWRMTRGRQWGYHTTAQNTAWLWQIAREYWADHEKAKQWD